MPGSRKIIDCRNFPSEKNCTLATSAKEEQVLDATVHHAAAVHGYQNTP